MNVVRGEMQMVPVTEGDAEDRKRWKQMIGCGDGSRRGTCLIKGESGLLKDVSNAILPVLN